MKAMLSRAGKRWIVLAAAATATIAVLYFVARPTSAPIVAPTIQRPPEEPPEQPPTAWSTLKGRVVWRGQIPDRREIEIPDSVRRALEGKSLFDESCQINRTNRGVRNAVVFVTGPPGKRGRHKTPPIHESLRQVPGGKVVFEVKDYRVEPRVFALREGTAVEGRWNPEIHNMDFYNSLDLRPGELGPPPPPPRTWTPVKALAEPWKITCYVCAWIKGYALSFDHPYFAVTDLNGEFEIPLAPCGERRLVVWHESMKGPFNGELVRIKELPENDLGEIGIVGDSYQR